MICPRCKTEITDGALICPSCGDWCAASAQKERVDNLKAERKGLVHKSFRSGLFQAMTILITVVAALTALNCFSLTAGEGRVSFNFDITVILYVIAAVFCWRAYTSSDQRIATEHLRHISIFEAAYWIIMLIAVCLIGIVIIFCFALIGVGDAAIAESWQEVEKVVIEAYGSTEVLKPIEELLSMGAGVLFGILAFAFALVEAYLVFAFIIHLKRRKFLKNFAACIELDNYTIEKNPPYTGAIVYAAIGLFSTFSTVITSINAGGFSVIALVNTIALNCYIIVSASWMTQLHKNALANNEEIENESAILNNLIYSSKIACENQTKEKAAENEATE